MRGWWRNGRRARGVCSRRGAWWRPGENRSSRGSGWGGCYGSNRGWYASNSGDDASTVMAILQMDLEIIERFARTRVVKL